jgi:putative acetyltransferase
MTALPAGYRVRRYRLGDEGALGALTLAAIRAIGARRYSSAQVGAWAARHPCPDRFVQRMAEGDVIYLAAGPSDEPVAYALLQPDGHLDMLYCHPDHTRKGLADELLAVCEAHARSEALARLFTEASELARPAFQRAGYEMLHRRDFAIEGVSIHNYAMEKQLTHV